MKKITSITKANIHFKQPKGLHIIALMTFFLCLCIAPFTTVLNDYSGVNFFYNRNDHLFVIFFAGIFGCLSNYLFGSTKSIIHGLQFIIIAIILSFIRNLTIFSSAVLWVGLAITIVNLLFTLSAFYLKTDLRRLYGFIGVYSSSKLGTAMGIVVYFFILKNMYHFKIFYLLIVCFLLIFFLKKNYKLNTSLTNQTERVNISFYGILIIFFMFAFILFFLLLNIDVFSSLNLMILPLSLIYLHILTISNNKENGKSLLKYVYFSLSIIVLNKIIYLNFIKYQHVINSLYINSAISTLLFLIAGYIICVIIYTGWRLSLITLHIESITKSHLIKIMLYIEAIRVFILAISVFSVSPLIGNLTLIIATLLALILNIFIIPIYFSLGKILAGGKNEAITTTLLYLIFSSLIFVSFLYDVSVSL